MDEATKKNLELRNEVHELASDIMCEVDHGECFYDSKMLNSFQNTLERMKKLSQEYYDSNQHED